MVMLNGDYVELSNPRPEETALSGNAGKAAITLFDMGDLPFTTCAIMYRMNNIMTCSFISVPSSVRSICDGILNGR